MKKDNFVICLFVLLFIVIIGIAGVFIWQLNRPINHSVTVRYMGEPYTFETSTVQIDLDEDNERFVFQFKNNGYVDVCEFNFDFDIYNGKSFSNCSQEFQYIDNKGHEIIFYENVSYCTHDDLTMYIYYKNASPEIKTAISEKTFSLYLGGYGCFRPC